MGKAIHFSGLYLQTNFETLIMRNRRGLREIFPLFDDISQRTNKSGVEIWIVSRLRWPAQAARISQQPTGNEGADDLLSQGLSANQTINCEFESYFPSRKGSYLLGFLPRPSIVARGAFVPRPKARSNVSCRKKTTEERPRPGTVVRRTPVKMLFLSLSLGFVWCGQMLIFSLEIVLKFAMFRGSLKILGKSRYWVMSKFH